MLLIVGKVVEKYAHKLEGCWCHAHIWAATGQTRKWARAVFRKTVGLSQCFRKGRMGPWRAIIGIKEMLAELSACANDTLEEMLDGLDTVSKQALLLNFQFLKVKLREIWT